MGYGHLWCFFDNISWRVFDVFDSWCGSLNHRFLTRSIKNLPALFCFIFHCNCFAVANFTILALSTCWVLQYSFNIFRFQASQADSAVYAALSGAPKAGFPHALRWYNHIKSFDRDRWEDSGTAMCCSKVLELVLHFQCHYNHYGKIMNPYQKKIAISG